MHRHRIIPRTDTCNRALARSIARMTRPQLYQRATMRNNEVWHNSLPFSKNSPQQPAFCIAPQPHPSGPGSRKDRGRGECRTGGRGEVVDAEGCDM